LEQSQALSALIVHLRAGARMAIRRLFDQFGIGGENGLRCIKAGF